MLSASILLGSALGTPVLAENTTSDNTQITYTVDESYDWTAPADFSFTENSNGTDTQTGTVTVLNNTIGSGNMLTISIADGQNFELTDVDNPGNKRTYSVSDGTTSLFVGSKILAIPSGTATDFKDLSFQMNTVDTEMAGNYSGTLRFTSKIISVNPTPIDFGSTFQTGYYVAWNTGSVNALSGFYASDFVELKQTYNALRIRSTAVYEGDGMAFYDVDHNYISGLGKYDASSGYWDVQIPSNAKYFKIGGQTSSFSGEYYYIDGMMSFGNTFSPGYYIDWATGKMLALKKFYASDYIPINMNYNSMKIRSTSLYEGDGMALYDADKNYITGYGLSSSVDGYWDFKIPSNAKYFRIGGKSTTFSGLYYDRSIEPQVYPDNILYIGNSLLLGFGNHGMASSEIGKDYYSLVNNYIEEESGATVTADRLGGADLERAASDEAANAWMEEYLKPYLSEERDLVIIQLGDNVNNATVFANTANNVIQYVRQYAPNAKVAWVAMWYNANAYLNTIKNACTNNDAVFIDIHDLNVSANCNVVGAEYIDKDGNVETITDSGVASHPNDQGFQQIANRIIATLF